MTERLAWSICLPLILALSLFAWLPIALLIYMLPFWVFCPHPLTVLWSLFGGWIP